MINGNITKFKSPILNAFAKIIVKEFRGTLRINRILKEIDNDYSVTTWKIQNQLHDIFIKIQNTSGSDKILGLVESICDPQEHIGNPKRQEKIIKKFNECLKSCSLHINNQNKVETIPKKQGTSNKTTKNNNLFNMRQFHNQVTKNAKLQFKAKHYFDAVDECCKAFEKYVSEKSKVTEHGSKLMSSALNKNGSLKLNKNTTMTEQNLQDGLMYLCMGLMKAIRNPVEHEPQSDHQINKQDALDILSFISYLYRQIEKCKYNIKVQNTETLR